MIKERRFFLFLVIAIQLSAILIFGGCQDRKELADLAIVLGIGIDKYEDNYLLTVELANPEAPDNLGTGKIFSVSGVTIDDAKDKLPFFVEKEMFWGHMQLIAVGESAASSMYEISKYFYLDKQAAPAPFVVIARDINAEELLKSQFGEAQYISFGIAEALKKLTQNEQIFTSSVGELLENMIDEKCVLLPVATITSFTDSANQKNQTAITGYQAFLYSEI